MVRVKLEDEVFYGAWGLLVLHMMGWATAEGRPISPTPDDIFERMRCNAVNEVVYQHAIRRKTDFLEEARDALSRDMRRTLGH